MDSWKCYKKTYSILKDLMNTLRSSSRSDLLQIKGLGPTKVDRIMEIRDSVAREGRPLRMRDVINLNRIGLGTLTEDPNAVDIAKCIAYYESEFSIDKKLHTMVRRYIIQGLFLAVTPSTTKVKCPWFKSVFITGHH